MHIPFVDLKSQYQSLKQEFDEAIQKVLSETAFIGGKYAKAFEEQFAEYLGVNYCVAVANGTDALEIGLQAIGVGKGDEVLVPANTSFAPTLPTASAVGAKAIFVDIDPRTYNIDAAQA